MYGNKSKNLERYQKAEGSYNTVKSGNQVIFGILKELERSMKIVASSIEKTKKWKPQEKDLDLKNKHFTKSLTAIYALQTSLNFDSNNKLAINLFQIYEYCRQQLIKGYSKKVVKDIIKAANAIKNILSSFEEGLSNA
jgi:flagellar protein FliS